jgi:hypothetical protein
MTSPDPRYAVAFTFGNPTQSALNNVGDADATLKLADTHWLVTAAKADLSPLLGNEFGVRYVDLLVCALKVYPVDDTFGQLNICERTISASFLTRMFQTACERGKLKWQSYGSLVGALAELVRVCRADVAAHPGDMELTQAVAMTTPQPNAATAGAWGLSRQWLAGVTYHMLTQGNVPTGAAAMFSAFPRILNTPGLLSDQTNDAVEELFQVVSDARTIGAVSKEKAARWVQVNPALTIVQAGRSR